MVAVRARDAHGEDEGRAGAGGVPKGQRCSSSSSSNKRCGAHIARAPRPAVAAPLTPAELGRRPAVRVEAGVALERVEGRRQGRGAADADTAAARLGDAGGEAAGGRGGGGQGVDEGGADGLQGRAAPARGAEGEERGGDSGAAGGAEGVV